MQQKVSVFVSYAHEDNKLRQQLDRHLSNLKRQQYIDIWHDRDISAGSNWKQEIDIHLSNAHIILLLISADFLASGYCSSIEMKRALDRHELGKSCVLPIILRPVDWKGAPFSHLQILPTGARPVAGRSWRNRDEAFADIAQGIRRAVERLNAQSGDKHLSEQEEMPPISTPPTKTHKNLSSLPQGLGVFLHEYDVHTDWAVDWQILSNPFLHTDNSNEMHRHVSGRSADILDIITGSQSAIILTGAPRIGKTALIRYLQVPPQEKWSWRKEERLISIREPLALDQMHFVQIDLSILENVQSKQEMLALFIKACIQALAPIYSIELSTKAEDLKGLRSLLRQIERQNPRTHCFIMLDSIERLDQSELTFPKLLQSEARTPQERGIAILNHCEVIRTLVDLIDDFRCFGVIFSLTSLPRTKSAEQFTHVSADLARFTTSTLQCFTWDDTNTFLAQKPEDIDNSWAQAFSTLGGNVIFTEDEQAWIREQAGTHPYLLQQCCFHMFNFKQTYAQLHRHWVILGLSDQKRLIELVHERVTTFLNSLWKRLQEALENASPETRRKFSEFLTFLTTCQTTQEIPRDTWDWLGTELRYILSNEGFIRNEPFQPVYTPGLILRTCLTQRGGEGNSVPTQHGFWLSINHPGYPIERISLSELEYRLLKTMQQHAHYCSEEELMQSVWGKTIEHGTFTQRMHHLRKKLKEHNNNTQLIINHYGGQYSLRHTDWLDLE